MKKMICLLASLCVICTGCGTGQSTQSSIWDENSISEPQYILPEDILESSDSSYWEDESSAIPESEPEVESELPMPSSAPPALYESAPEVSSAPTASSSSAAEEAEPQVPLSQPPVASSELDRVALEVVQLINEKRKSLGLGQLVYDDNLTQAALIRSREMYQNGYFAHSRPNGDSWETVLNVDVPTAYMGAGENLAQVEHNMPNYDPSYDASYWYTTWENSPTHYENMIRPSFTHVGLKIYRRVENGMVMAVATTLFAYY